MPDFVFEDAAYASGRNCVAGVDEAGRGPLAGPVVVAAIILDRDAIPEGLNDSKKLSAKRRCEVFDEICTTAQISVVSAPPRIISKLNIRGATLWAMARAVSALPEETDFALIDGRDLPPALNCEGQAVIGGDGKSLSIAAASIVAKVTRDMMCPIMDAACPGYGFASHKGYGTSQHLLALKKLGATPHHRTDFRPVAEVLQSFNPVV